jgi:hypothetical protein
MDNCKTEAAQVQRVRQWKSFALKIHLPLLSTSFRRNAVPVDTSEQVNVMKGLTTFRFRAFQGVGRSSIVLRCVWNSRDGMSRPGNQCCHSIGAIHVIQPPFDFPSGCAGDSSVEPWVQQGTWIDRA